LKEDAKNNVSKNEKSSFVRKTATAVAGGAIVGIGLVMIPLPTPCGAVVAGCGMAVLGTEFPAAKRVLGKACNTVADVIERSVKENRDGEEQELSPELCASPSNYSNEKMRNLIEEKQNHTGKDSKFDIKKSVKDLGKKAVPVIRKIGEGVDQEKIDAATASISKVAKDTRETVSNVAKTTHDKVSKGASQFAQGTRKTVSNAAKTTHDKVSKGASQFWRNLMVLDNDEDLTAPFATTPRSSPQRNTPRRKYLEKISVESENEQTGNFCEKASENESIR